MLDVLVLDPGAKRCGWAYRKDGRISCFSHGPEQAEDWFNSLIKYNWSKPDIVIMEQWVSYPHATAGNAWRDLREVRVLGAVEFLCRKNGINYLYQPTGLLKPTMAMADARGYQWVAENRDEKAAETHLYYFEHQQTEKEEE